MAAGDEQRMLDCDLGGLTEADLGTVEALATLKLVAWRAGLEVRFRGARPELEELLALTGLADLVLGIQPRGQPEHGEQPRGVEEGVEPDDPSA